MSYYDTLLANGYTWDPVRRGYVRKGLKWNEGAGGWDGDNVGGTAFIPAPQTADPLGGISGMASPRTTAPRVSAARLGSVAMGSAPTVARTRAVRADGVSGTVGRMALPEWGAQDVRGSRVDPFSTRDNEVLAELERQAIEDLGLGGGLSAQDERGAQQAARAAFSARGLAMGRPAAVAEVLTRDALARERRAERRAFAGGVSGMLDARAQSEAERADRIALANQAADLEAQRANQQAGVTRWTTLVGAEEENARLATQIALANQEAQLRADLANAQTEAERARLQAQLEETVAARNQRTQLDLATGGAELAQQAALANQNAELQAALANQNAELQTLRLGYEDRWNQRGAGGVSQVLSSRGREAATARGAENVAQGRNPRARAYTDIGGVTRWVNPGATRMTGLVWPRQRGSF
jgi:hypothetical protein